MKIDANDVYAAVAVPFSLVPLRNESEEPVEPDWQQWSVEKRRYDYSDFISGPGQPINAGITAGPASEVIICRLYNKDDDFNYWKDEQGDFNELPETFTVKVGRHLYELYYRWPSDSYEYSTTKISEDATILGIGSFGLAPGSVIPETKESCTIVRAVPVAKFPEKIRERILEIKSECENIDDGEEKSDNPSPCTAAYSIDSDSDEFVPRTFSVGQTVQLKSGGQAMVVSEVDEIHEDEYEITCGWFKDSTFIEKTFKEELLCAVGLGYNGKNHYMY